jgi:radical SAM superfamily enzyme with C-terminal helix-hairpin-helix motif
LLIQIPIPEAKARLKEAKKIMVDASIKIVGGPISVEHDEIKENFIQEPEDQKRFDQIMEAIKNYKLTTELTSSNYQNDSTALYD